MQKNKSKTKNEILTKLNELETLLKRQNEQPLNFVEAAKYLSISQSHLYKLTSQRKIPFHKPTGKYLYFFKHELNEWIGSKEHSAKSEVTEAIEDAEDEETEDASNHSKYDYE